MTTATDRLEMARAAYNSAGKDVARAIVLGLARQYRLNSILDLWGGGGFARLVRGSLPEATLVSAERDPLLIPFLLQEAQQFGYVAHAGDLATAPGLYDLVWADLCSQASKSTERTIRDSAAKVSPGGLLLLTIMPAREADVVLTGEARLLHLPLWLEGITSMRVRLLFPYRRDRGLPMWLLALTRASSSAFHSPSDVEWIANVLARDGYWMRGLDLPTDVLFLLDLINPEYSGSPDLTPARAVRHLGYRTVDVRTLDPETRELVLSLVALKREGARRKAMELVA